MTILAVDCCEIMCSAALVGSDGTVLADRSESLERGHAERLLPLIEELLDEAGMTFSGLTRLAVTTGPGNFTGLRVGLSVMRGLALALDVPLVGVSALSVLAWQSGSGPTHIVMRGRGQHCFHQYFERANEDIETEDAGGVRTVAEINERINAQPGRIVGSAAPEFAPDGACVYVDCTVLARVALEADPESYPADPHYLRAPDAIVARPLLPILDHAANS